MWAFYTKGNLFDERYLAFSFSYSNKRYNFYLEPETGGKRAKLASYQKTISSENITQDFDLFENGVKKEVYVYPQSWSLITLKPKDPQILNDALGQFEISPGILIKNFTSYENSIVKRVDDIFESHLGLSNIVAQDDSTLSINSEGLNVFSDIRWTNFSGKPV
jgi:hypothetical protein